jgi:hypothetical protein
MEQKLGTEFSEKTLNIHNFYLLVKWLLSVVWFQNLAEKNVNI